MERWPNKRMEELCDVTSSKRIYARELVASGVPFYKSKEIIEKVNGQTTHSNPLFISEERFQEILKQSGAPSTGDVLLTSRGTLGVPYVVREHDRFHFADGNLTWFRNFKELDSRYLKYFFLSPSGKAELAKCVIGSSQLAYTIASLKKIRVACPPLEEQRRIAGILSAYDDLIENNLRRIKILEEMARAIYREWFVDFKFPGHENVKLVDAPTCHAVASAKADGKIPEGWEVSEFRNLFDIRYGKTLPKTKISDSGRYPVYGAGAVIGFYDKMLCPEKCVLVTSRGNGSGTVWRTREPAFVTNNSLIILPREECQHWDYSFVELLLEHSNVMQAKTGSAQPQVTIENLSYVKAVVPAKDLVEKFCACVTTICEQVDLLFEHSKNLRRTRDLLLPRLVNGDTQL